MKPADDPRLLAPALTSAPPVPRLALTKAEAAEAIGCSVDFLEEHVMPELRLVRRGRKVLVPIRELERWLDRSAARTLDGER